MSDIKPKSFRVDDETAEKFKEISAQLGGNQQQTLAKLIETFELQSGKVNFPENKEMLEDFERYVTAINRLFLSTLDKTQDIKKTVQAEFESLLKAKDNTIVDLQEKLSVLIEEAKENKKNAADYKNINEQLTQESEDLKNEYMSKLETMNRMQEDKDQLNIALSNTCNELETKVISLSEEVKQSALLLEENNDLREKLESSEHEYEKQSLENQKTILEMRAKHNEEITELKEKYLSEIERYQQNYKTLIEKQTPKRSVKKTVPKNE